jgi:two-component system, chemotaxis family, chemotaxis protein CheY
MKILIVEDDFTSRTILQQMLEPYGTCDVAVNGYEAVEAFGQAMKGGQPYDLVCLDIKMPVMDGQEALKRIRGLEWADGIVSMAGAKIVMTTVLDDLANVSEAYVGMADGYLTKPIEPAKLLGLLTELQLTA